MNARRRYEDLLWWTMDVTGVSRSIRRKVLLAVGIQFGVSVAQVLLPSVLSGQARLAATVGLFGLAIVAFGNTVLVVEHDIVEPITNLDTASSCIARGELDTDIESDRSDDEIGSLVGSFSDMCDHLRDIAAQAEALADQDFDHPAIDRDLPGRFGNSLRRMTDNLELYIERVEADRDRLQLLNYLTSHDVPNHVNVILGRIDLLRDHVDRDPDRAHLDSIEEQAEEIMNIAEMVGTLSDEEGADAVDIDALLQEEIERVRSTYPDATIEADLPGEPTAVRGNDLLTSAFSNLITNAVEHNDGDRPSVEVGVETGPNAVQVRVADDGPGIDAESPEAFFESLSPGTGLNIVYTIVEQLGGEVTFESDASGTTFVVELPTGRRRAGDFAAAPK